MRLLLVMIAAGSLVCGGCVTTPGTATRGTDRNRITSENLREVDTSAQTLGHVVQRLRPWWLQSRSTTIMGQPILPVVYLDGSRFGEIELLGSIPVHEVEDVEFLSPGDATTRYGTGHAGGVIAVRSRR